jgi:murein DD-endopeptidase MepM/ murein hydrolase activator NlpD
MNKQYFVVELAHSASGQVKRIRVSYKTLACIFGTFLILTAVAFGACSSYLRMFWKVSNYNQLRADFDRLRGRYQKLQQVSRQHTQQMASLETLASEVSVAYGISPPTSPDLAPMDDDNLTSLSTKESIEEYNFLKAANFSRIFHNYAHQWQAHSQPNLWPVIGLLRSSFGRRSDPFSGEGAFHTGIDIAVPAGTPVHVTADGVVEAAGWRGGYGKLVIIDHGNGLETCYAHLSQLLVVPGAEVRRNQIIALTGTTGHTTGPHIHYEVRVAGTAVNPYRYLGMSAPKPEVASTGKSTHNDLGL